LKYATKAGDTWQTQVVDGLGDVGQYTSLALDAGGFAHISYTDQTTVSSGPILQTGGAHGLHVKYADNATGRWVVENADASGTWSQSTSLALDAAGRPQIAFYDAANHILKRVVKTENYWTLETVDDTGLVGEYPSLLLDRDGAAHVCYYDLERGDLKYASEAVELREPRPGDVWEPGSSRAIRWDGSGQVTVSLSTDGGQTYTVLGSNIDFGELEVTVPDTPSARCKVRAERTSPASRAVSDSTFAIAPAIPLTVRPLPYRTGLVTITYTVDAVRDGASDVRVAVYDLRGRLVRTLARGEVLPGRHTTAWDARDERNRPVTAGLYVVRYQDARTVRSRSILVLR
jgi:hypothetical protein